MNAFKSVLSAAIGLSLISAGHAATEIKFTGSSAYRGSVHTAIGKILNTGYKLGYTGNQGLGKASQAIFEGTLKSNGAAVVIKTSWSGSVAGIQTVAGSLPVTFFPTGTVASGTQANISAPTATEVPDVAMSDTWQSATPFNKTYAGRTYAALNSDTLVGVVPFVWLANAGAPAALDNVTPQIAKMLFGNGSISLATITGLHADQATSIFAIGRDADSGTRLTAFAESGVGVNSFVQQYQPILDGSNNVIGQDLWPVSTVNGITFDVGNGGYSSGGTLASVMAKPSLAAIGGYWVTYVSTGDATSALGSNFATTAKVLNYNGASLPLTWNGSAYVWDYTPLYEGRYTFWSYEHLMYNTTKVTGTAKLVADTLASQILNTDATIKLIDMQVSRAEDGGQVGQNY